MDTIRLGTKNDALTLAVRDVDGRYYPLTSSDLEYEQADAMICYDSGIYPGIADVDQYMCDKATNL